MMKRIITACFVFAIVLAHTSHAEMVCAETDYGRAYKNNLPTLDGEEIIQINSPLIEGSKIKCHVNYSVVDKSNIRIRSETGVLEGVKYRIWFSDGSGSVQGLSTNTSHYPDKYETNWHTICELDEMDDTPSCFLFREDLRIGIWENGMPFIQVGSSHYPDSNIAVRVDKNKPITASEKTGFTKAQSLEIIGQLKKGYSVLTRYQERPYQSNKDTSMKLFGFPQAWAILQKLHESVGAQQ